VNRFLRILSNPSKYLHPNHIINKVIAGRLFLYWRKLSPFIKSDRLYLKVYYRLAMGKSLNLDNPKTFTEKIQWLKMHNTDPVYSKMVDKYQVREIVAAKIGESYLIPLLGVYNSFEEIKLEELPEKFVIKTTHDSGNVVVCTNRKEMDLNAARIKLTKALGVNYFYLSREYPYKNAIPRIIAEAYIETDTSHLGMVDYKFFCFNGEPKFVLVVTGRGNDVRNNFFDMDFKPFEVKGGFVSSDFEICKPKNFEKMIDIARIVSKDLIHVRIDLYNIAGKIYFGEYTFHHNGGLTQFEEVKEDLSWGKLINLKNLNIE
jgi:hypothetical protein